MPSAAFADDATVRVHDLGTDRYLDASGSGLYTGTYGDQQLPAMAVLTRRRWRPPFSDDGPG